MTSRPLFIRPGPAAARRRRGFTMIEVLVTLLVLSIGLLGVAKMLSLAMGSTKVSGSRAIASILAASMASSMHADRAYWSSANTVAAKVSVTGSHVAGAGYSTTVLAGDTTLAALNGSAAPNCLLSASNPAPNCGSAQLAAYDLMQWGQQIAQQLPAPVPATPTPAPAAISCSPNNLSPTVPAPPVTCTITLTWAENAVSALNAQASSSASQTVANDQISLLVEP